MICAMTLHCIHIKIHVCLKRQETSLTIEIKGTEISVGKIRHVPEVLIQVNAKTRNSMIDRHHR